MINNDDSYNYIIIFTADLLGVKMDVFVWADSSHRVTGTVIAGMFVASIWSAIFRKQINTSPS